MIKLQFSNLLLLFVLLLLFQIGIATNTNHCPPTTCGGTSISYPFRLKTDPIGCGDDEYELSCENNFTVLHLGNGGKYNVQAINYDKLTIRLVDASVDKDDCSSIPSFPLSSYSFGYGDGRYSLSIYKQTLDFSIIRPTEMISFISCENPVKSSDYMDTSPCINYSSPSHSGIYTYAYVGEMKIHDLRDGCSIEMASLMMLPRNYRTKSSFIEVHRQMAFGFQLSWHNFNFNCRNCSSGICYQDSQDHIECLEGSSTKLIATGATVGSILLVGAVVILHRMYISNKIDREYQSKIDKFLDDYKSFKPSRFSFADIKRMTNQFKDELGQGAYGTVYRGKLSHEIMVAVKVLTNSIGNGEEFVNEVGTIGRIHHVNVVRLFGFCADGFRRALVYEYLPNDSLHKFISSSDTKRHFLGWKRLKDITLGIAKGIDYLHQGCDQRILHFDIKPQNILLDHDFNPKVSDFGLAKLCGKDQSAVSMTTAKGTIGYMAPEVFSRNFGNVSYKSDVYSFGMLVLEMVGGRKIVEETMRNDEQIYFPEWIYNLLEEGEDLRLEIEEEEDAKIAKKLAVVGLWCIQWNPVNRPSMKTVVKILEGEDNLPIPPNPFSSTASARTNTKLPRRGLQIEMDVIAETE